MKYQLVEPYSYKPRANPSAYAYDQDIIASKDEGHSMFAFDARQRGRVSHPSREPDKHIYPQAMGVNTYKDGSKKWELSDTELRNQLTRLFSESRVIRLHSGTVDDVQEMFRTADVPFVIEGKNDNRVYARSLDKQQKCGKLAKIASETRQHGGKGYVIANLVAAYFVHRLLSFQSSLTMEATLLTQMPEGALAFDQLYYDLISVAMIDDEWQPESVTIPLPVLSREAASMLTRQAKVRKVSGNDSDGKDKSHPFTEVEVKRLREEVLTILGENWIEVVLSKGILNEDATRECREFFRV